MEITKSNFSKLLPSVKEAIDSATFIAIDCELTGLVGRQDGINVFDTQKEYYEKSRNSARQFLVIQYGVCCFRYVQEDDMFKHSAFNFYTFAAPVNKYIPDKIFSCQSSSIDFLIKEGFDFNKLFKEGIPYLNLAEETKYKDGLAEMQKQRASGIVTSPGSNQSNLITVSAEDKPFIDNIFKLIEDFLSTNKEELVLPKCNSFLRRLIYQSWDSAGHDRYNLESRTLENKDRVLVVTRPKSVTTKLQENKLKEEEEVLEFENTKGFSKVIRYISESGKLVVGHNMMLDLLHSMEKFLINLPQDYEEFKECAHCLFPKILDTKHMSSSAYFKELIPSSVLPHVVETVSKEPFTPTKIEIEDNRKGYCVSDAMEHVAAYDAFITGYSLIAMWKYMGTMEECPNEVTFKNLDLLKPYLNKIHLMRITESPFIRLGGADPVAPRDHVFYIKFPKDWKTNDIAQLFSPFGGVQIGWLDGTSAYVGLLKRDNTAVAYSTLSQSDTYTILPYAKRQAQLQGFSGLSKSPTPRRNKRSLELMQPSSKKRRTNSFGENSGQKRSIDPIVENPELEIESFPDTGIPMKREVVPEIKVARKRTLSKTFQENSSWE